MSLIKTAGEGWQKVMFRICNLRKRGMKLINGYPSQPTEMLNGITLPSIM